LKKSRTEKAAQTFADLTFVMTSLQAAGRNINGQGFKALEVFFQKVDIASSQKWHKADRFGRKPTSPFFIFQNSHGSWGRVVWSVKVQL
jgi:hypothetical protein